LAAAGSPDVLHLCSFLVASGLETLTKMSVIESFSAILIVNTSVAGRYLNRGLLGLVVPHILVEATHVWAVVENDDRHT